MASVVVGELNAFFLSREYLQDKGKIKGKVPSKYFSHKIICLGMRKWWVKLRVTAPVLFRKSSPTSPVRVCTRPSAVPMLARNPLHPTHPIARASVPRPFHPRLPREPVQQLPDFHPFLALLFCPPWCLPTNATAVLLLAHAGAQKKDDQLDIIASLTCASFARN